MRELIKYLLVGGSGVICIAFISLEAWSDTRTVCTKNGLQISCETYEEDLPRLRFGDKKWCTVYEGHANCKFDTKAECNRSFDSKMAGFLNTRKVCKKNPGFEDEDE